MARPLFEQYKDALRRGHVALLGDELDAALTAYREAGALVPDRPLPFASMGGVLERLGRLDEALVAYDRALALTPDDRALTGARDALARTLDGRTPGSLAVPASGPVAAPEAVAAPKAVAAPEAAGATESAVAPTPVGPPPMDAAALEADAAALAEMRAAFEDQDGTDRPEAPAAASSDTPAGRASAGEPSTEAGGGVWPAIDLPSIPEPRPAGPPPDPAVLQADADASLDAGDEAGARERLLTAVTVHRDAGRLDAALDAGLQLLAIAPGDPRVHIAIANLQLDREWRAVATEKIELLLRLTSLSGDAQAEADVHLLAAERLRDESPARLDARRRGLPTP